MNEAIKPIEFDADMERFYIPVNSHYEIQTKGKGSSFRIANTETHERMLVTDERLHPILEDMAKGCNAELKQSEALLEEQSLTIQVLNTCIGGEGSTTTENIRLVDRLEAKLAIAVDALDKLSRLGREPAIGNSIGNTMALDALNKIRGE